MGKEQLLNPGTGYSVKGLRDLYGLNRRQEDLLRASQVTAELARDWEVKRTFAQSFLGSAEALQAKAGTTLLKFAPIPTELRPHNLDKINMRLLSVPVLPLEDRDNRDVRKMYGGYLQAAEAGNVPTNDTGHYTCIDDPGDKTELSKRLGINDLRKASMRDIRRAILENGEDALKEYGYYTKGLNVEIDVITAEEAMLSAAAGHPVDGITRTFINDTQQYVYVENGKASYRYDTDTDVSPRLVIRFGKKLPIL